jgi:hypothetical protein
VLNCVPDVKDYRQLSPFLAFAVVRERVPGSEREGRDAIPTRGCFTRAWWWRKPMSSMRLRYIFRLREENQPYESRGVNYHPDTA